MSAPAPSSERPRHGRSPVEKEVLLYLGGVHASEEPLRIRTLLGSCIAVCLFDPVRGVGGMNHFMLPQGGATDPEPDSARFGVHAMDRLLTAVHKVGGDRRRLVAKVFGGARVLDLPDQRLRVAEQNIAFIQSFLDAEHLPIASQDLGGTQPREVHFYTGTGQVFVRRTRSPRIRQQLAGDEQQVLPPPAYGKVVFFATE
jgi:chemotaxis receptor (MCP) glutamine deamidase CheD